MVIKEYQAQWFTSFFDKTSSGKGVASEPNYQLANELHKQIMRKFKDGVDLAHMQSLSEYNKGIKY